MIEHRDVVVVGGGVAGLLSGRWLQQQGADFVILEARPRIGDSWRERYDSLRLFSYRRYAELPGVRMPIGVRQCPTRDELADYLESSASTLGPTVRTGTTVQRVSRDAGRFLVEGVGPEGRVTISASAVVVAAGAHCRPVRPSFADRLDPHIRQLHSLQYRSPAGLPSGTVLVVGAGNSGTDVALDLARAGHPTVLAGRHPGQTPFPLDSVPGFVAAHVLLFALRHLTVRSRPGRAARARLRGHGLMLIRNKLADLDRAGVRRVGRIEAQADGLPVTDVGETLSPASIVWCTGSRPDLRWLDIDGALDEDGEPAQTEGIADEVPGLGFVGLDFQYSAASGTIQGMDRDARAVVRTLLRSSPATAPWPARA